MSEQISTVAELDALPVGSVIRCDDAEGIGLNVAERHAGGWQYVGSALYFSSAQVASDEMAFTVLYRPDEPQRVQPSRKDVARALAAANDTFWDFDPENPDDVYLRDADAVLALLPGRTEAEVKAEALREFAAAMVGHFDWRAQLDGRLNRIERGADQ